MSQGDPRGAVESSRPSNRLAREKSPYLLQHARNPVNWFPWGEEAFAEARAAAKPILLSIGYSTCHWCHVMERESFADEGLATVLNQWFVAVKVDREERPDVDRLYMTAAQAMGVGGGWPLNLFLTPGLAPFYGGTYFPPEPRHGRPSFRQVLESVHRAWLEQPARIEQSSQRVLAALAALDEAEARAATPTLLTSPPTPEDTRREELFVEAFHALEQSCDHQAGGFGSAPKFPSVGNLDFLLRCASGMQAGEAGEWRDRALEMVTSQLDAMRAGGIHDQLGGGFHRYSTDAHWLVPHFEKMLYDQAQLAWIYLDAFLLTGRVEYAETARGVLAYGLRDLTAGLPAGRGLEGAGPFCSAEDADSEGEEGRFYVWTPAETAAALGSTDASLADFVFGITAAGNFARGASVLSLAHTGAQAARRFGITEAEVEQRRTRARARLLEARGRRPRPSRDDKVVTAWNGLFISALARGARALGDPALAERAASAARFLWTELRHDGEPAGAGARGGLRLRRRWREGEAAGEGQLADYANFAFGLVDLYQATHEPAWLERAAALTEAMRERFYDGERGAFFESPAGDESIPVRMKDGFDGAEIAGNSIAAHVLQCLGSLFERRDWLDQAGRTFAYYARRLAGGAVAMPRLLVAMDLAAAPARHVVVAGDPQAEDTRALVRECDRRFLPRDVLLVVDGAEWSRRLANLVPFAASLSPRAGRATAYVCVDYACRLPVTDARALAAQLDAPGTPE